MKATLFLAILLAFNAYWWWRSDRLLRPLRRSKLWRILLGGFTLTVLGLFALFVLPRVVGTEIRVPRPLSALLFVWTLIVLPAAVVGLLLMDAALSPIKLWSRWRRPKSVANGPAPNLSRRAFLGSVAALPPAAALAGTAVGLSQLDSFRVRRLTVPLANLPPALDGLTIAHVADLHVGEFVGEKLLREMVDRTNALSPDLILATGDFVNHALADLPAAAEAVMALRGRFGTFACEGNHDLFEGREAFQRQAVDLGLNLLVNAADSTVIRGQKVQILGQRWGGPRPGGGRSYTRSDGAINASFDELKPLIDSAAFGILLAHHPHAFDPAAAAGIPLTLSGHTHGGQLNLTKHLGFGALMYRYWSGLYRQGSSAAVVSNGVGNWFPLRINAPAEIVHLTLRRAESA